MTCQTALDPAALSEATLSAARGVIADCAHHSDADLIEACETVLRLSICGEDTHKARLLLATIRRTT